MVSMGMWGNEIVCRTHYILDSEEGRDLGLLNLATDEVKWYSIPCCSHLRGFYNYAESLVSVDVTYLDTKLK